MIARFDSARLTLRGWQLADFDGYAAFATDGHRLRFTDGGAGSRARAWDTFCAMAGQWLLRGYGVFALEEKASGCVCGYSGLWHPHELDEPELCWSLYGEFEGKGYATEAARAVQRWAHDTLGLTSIMSFVHPENVASQNVAGRIGGIAAGETLLRGMPRLVFTYTLGSKT